MAKRVKKNHSKSKIIASIVVLSIITIGLVVGLVSIQMDASKNAVNAENTTQETMKMIGEE